MVERYIREIIRTATAITSETGRGAEQRVQMVPLVVQWVLRMAHTEWNRCMLLHTILGQLGSSIGWTRCACMHNAVLWRLQAQGKLHDDLLRRVDAERLQSWNTEENA